MKAIPYARVSCRHLQIDGFSIDTQLEGMRALAEQQGWTIVAEYVEYESAFDEGLTRAELTKLLEFVRTNGADVLIFFSSDRFTRDVADGVILRRELYRLGVKLFVCYPSAQEIRSDNELVNILTDWQAQQYVEKLREASMRGYKAKIESGAYGQGTPPYGYRIEGERREARLVIDEEQARIVRWVFEWFVVDNVTSTQIAHRLNDLGVPTPGEVQGRAKKRAVGMWDQTTICKMLHKETYAGTWHARQHKKVGKNRIISLPREEWFPIPCAAIVPREMWEEAQEKLAARMHARNVRHNYLMGRRLKCSCGYSIRNTTKHVNEPHQKRYYVCCAYRNVQGKCGLPGFPADILEEAVWQWICKLMDNPEALLQGYQSAQEEVEKQHAHLKQQLEVLTEQIGVYDEKLTRLLDLYLEGGFPKDVLDVRKEEYNAILERMRIQRKSLNDQIENSILTDDDIASISAFVNTIKAQLADINDADFATKRQLVEALNLKGILKVEDGVKVLYLHWCFRDYRLALDGRSDPDEGAESGSIKSTAGTPTPQRRTQ